MRGRNPSPGRGHHRRRLPGFNEAGPARDRIPWAASWRPCLAPAAAPRPRTASLRFPPGPGAVAITRRGRALPPVDSRGRPSVRGGPASAPPVWAPVRPAPRRSQRAHTTRMRRGRPWTPRGGRPAPVRPDPWGGDARQPRCRVPSESTRRLRPPWTPEARAQGGSVRATRKPRWSHRKRVSSPIRAAERRSLGGAYQEPPRSTRFAQSPDVHALPSTGAP